MHNDSHAITLPSLCSSLCLQSKKVKKVIWRERNQNNCAKKGSKQLQHSTIDDNKTISWHKTFTSSNPFYEALHMYIRSQQCKLYYRVILNITFSLVHLFTLPSLCKQSDGKVKRWTSEKGNFINSIDKHDGKVLTRDEVSEGWDTRCVVVLGKIWHNYSYTTILWLVLPSKKSVKQVYKWELRGSSI